jgi:HEAT repeat protein
VRSTPTDVEATDQFAVFRALAEGDRHSADELPRLFGALSVARTAASATPLLEQICAVAEASIRRGDGRGALAAVHGLVKSEHEVRAPDVRRAYIVSLRRVTTPALLESLVRQAVDAASPESVVTAATDVLTRVGDEGVLAVVERYVAAPTTTVREQCMRLLETLGAGASAFGRALAGRRPLVARAAAELAATLGMSDAEGALAAALGHDDAGVRRAAAEALGRLATPRAADALARALRDDDAGVRAQAALAVATAHPANAVALLSDALAAEADPQVQFACLQGLARLGSGEAVDVLARAASPDRTGFPTKGTAMRVAAVHALAPLRVPGVASALQAIANDKDRAVRAALAQATRLHGRRSTRAMPAVNG